MSYEPCGFAATCGRKRGHKGHHGGWRTGVSGTAPDPVAFDDARARLGSELGPVDIAVLVDYLYHGDMASVAKCLSLSIQTVKNHVTTIHQRTGTSSTIASLRALGWIQLPAGLAGRH